MQLERCWRTRSVRPRHEQLQQAAPARKTRGTRCTAARTDDVQSRLDPCVTLLAARGVTPEMRGELSRATASKADARGVERKARDAANLYARLLTGLYTGQ